MPSPAKLYKAFAERLSIVIPSHIPYASLSLTIAHNVDYKLTYGLFMKELTLRHSSISWCMLNSISTGLLI